MKTLKLFTLLFFVLVVFGSLAGPNEDLVIACQKGDLEGVKKAMSAGAQVNTLDAGGNAPISYAFFWPEIVKYLLDNKADPNLGNTLLLYQASFYSSADVIKLALDAGADPNKPSKSAAAAGLVKMIEDEKAKGKKGSKDNIKAWEMAVKLLPTEIYNIPGLVTNSNCVSCLQMLLDKGAKVELGVNGETLLHTFAAGGASPEYRNSVYATIKPSIESYGFAVPDWYLKMPEDRNGTADQILKVLLSKSLNVNEKNKGIGGMPPQTPLEVALNTGFGNREAVMLALINNGADVKVVSGGYGPAIFQASQTGFVSVVKAMVEHGADINTEGSFFGQTEGVLLKGYTPLSIAALKDNLELVKYLIGAGAKTDIGVEGKFFNSKTGCLTKVSDKTAIYYAIENGNVDMVKFMVESDVKWWKRLKI